MKGLARDSCEERRHGNGIYLVYTDEGCTKVEDTLQAVWVDDAKDQASMILLHKRSLCSWMPGASRITLSLDQCP